MWPRACRRSARSRVGSLKVWISRRIAGVFVQTDHHGAPLATIGGDGIDKGHRITVWNSGRLDINESSRAVPAHAIMGAGPADTIYCMDKAILFVALPMAMNCQGSILGLSRTARSSTIQLHPT
jgi:hypothetical protein